MHWKKNWMISMRHARCLRRLDKDELEWFSTRCHLYNGTSIKKHSSVMASVRNTGDEASNVQTVALAGLVLAQRSQALTTLTLKDILVSENGTRFCVSRLLKTSRPGKSSTPIMVPKNSSNGRLCPHTTLQTCISRTESVSVRWYMEYIEVLTFSGFCMHLLN